MRKSIGGKEIRSQKNPLKEGEKGQGRPPSPVPIVPLNAKVPKAMADKINLKIHEGFWDVTKATKNHTSFTYKVLPHKVPGKDITSELVNGWYCLDRVEGLCQWISPQTAGFEIKTGGKVCLPAEATRRAVILNEMFHIFAAGPSWINEEGETVFFTEEKLRKRLYALADLLISGSLETDPKEGGPCKLPLMKIEPKNNYQLKQAAESAKRRDRIQKRIIQKIDAAKR